MIHRLVCAPFVVSQDFDGSRWFFFFFLFFRYRVDDRTKSASEGAETADYSAVEGREMAL